MDLSEKLLALSSFDFPGLSKINEDFDKISSMYLNDYYLKNKNNNFTKYFTNIVDIQPNIYSNIKDEKIQILSLVKKSIQKNNYNESLKHLSLLDNRELYFNNWVEEVKYYLEVSATLQNFQEQ